jgi:membrane protein implicated in regulation of membrane protease activity
MLRRASVAPHPERIHQMAERSIVALIAASDDLAGNWSWTVWLLIPLVLILAFVTARCVGPLGEPPRRHSGERGVSSYLARRATSEEEDR